MFLLLLTASLFSCSFTGKQVKKDKNIIYWSKEVKLTWDDFRGDEKDLIGSQSAVASVTFNYTETFSGDITILATFNKKESLKRKQDISDELLRHEQYHFNIAELFARKLKRDLSQIDVISSANYIKERYDFFYNEYVIYQELYDKETNHSKNVSKQKEWEDSIEKQLIENSKFSKATISVKFK